MKLDDLRGRLTPEAAAQKSAEWLAEQERLRALGAAPPWACWRQLQQDAALVGGVPVDLIMERQNLTGGLLEAWVIEGATLHTVHHEVYTDTVQVTAVYANLRVEQPTNT